MPIEVKYNEEYVYVGQFKPATNTLHGIGIRVHNSVYIREGYWKDGYQDGNGRDTGIKVENIKHKIRGASIKNLLRIVLHFIYLWC